MADLKLTDIKGVGSAKAKQLISHGFNSVSDIVNCSVYELCLIPGVNQISANTLKSNVKQLLDNQKLLSGQSKTEINSTQDKKKDSKHKKKKQKDKKKNKKKKKKKKTKGKSKKKKSKNKCFLSCK